MKKNYLFIPLLILYSIPTILFGDASLFNTCNLPGVNPLIFFPFGQKSNDVKIACIQKGTSNIEHISFKLPVDRKDIGRLVLPHMSLRTLLGDAIKTLIDMMHSHSNNKDVDDFIVVPKLLFFKKNIHSVIGIELCFPENEQTILKIQRIIIFFMQNITQYDTDETDSFLGFNRLAVYNAGESDNNMIIIGEKEDQKREIHELLVSLFKSIIAAHSNYITHTLLATLESIVESLAKSSIGLMIEEVDRVHNAVIRYHALKNISSVLLDDDEYLFYNSTDKNALSLIEIIQKNKIPLTSNYYLYGTIMGYHEKFIMFYYQLEAYLQSINSINADGTIRWPYNIPKWIKKNKSAIDDWVDNRWNAPFYFVYPKERRRYERDKKKAQKYLKHIPSFFIP